MEQTSKAHITYVPRSGATGEGELDALSVVYRYLLLEKGDHHDLTNDSTAKTVENGPRTTESENT